MSRLVRAFDLDPATTLGSARRERTARRVLAALLVAIVAAASAGYLGVREQTARAVAGDGTELEVRFQRITRRGLSTPLGIQVRRSASPFGRRPVVLRISSSYFELLDTNDIQPAPAAERSEGEAMVLEFDPPERSDTLRIHVDSRVDPSFGGSRSALVELVEGRRRLAAVDIATRVLP